MFELPGAEAPRPPWTRIFIEVALRALMRLHHDYLLYSTNQMSTDEPDFRALNSGPGVAYADELTVCAAIAQEFLATRYVSGGMIDDALMGRIQKGKRNYHIEREAQYPSTDRRADFRITRIGETPKCIIGKPSLVEAKQAYLWTTKLASATDQRPVDQSGLIFEDIKKLREAAGAALRRGEPLRGYVLVWNVQEKGTPTDEGVSDYFSRVKGDTVVPWQVRLSPLSSTQGASVSDVLVDRWLWVVLAEVTDLDPGDLQPS